MVFTLALLATAAFAGPPSGGNVTIQQLLTDQTMSPILSALPNAPLMGIPTQGDSDPNGNVLWTSNGTALFYRPSGGSTIRVAQYGDPYPGMANSKINFFSDLKMSGNGKAVVKVQVATPSGYVSALAYFNGSTLSPVVDSTQIAPGTANLPFGSFETFGIDNAGDVGFIADIQSNSTTFIQNAYIVPFGGAAVRVLGNGDSAPGPGATSVTVSNLSSSSDKLMNTAGEMLLSGNFSGSPGGPAVWAAILSSPTTATLRKVVAYGDLVPNLGPTTFSSINTAIENNAGQTVFLGNGGLYFQSVATGIVPVATPGSPASSDLGGVLSPSNLTPIAINDSGTVLFSTGITANGSGTNSNYSSVLYRASLGSGPTYPVTLSTVAYSGQTLGNTSQTQAVATANVTNGVVTSITVTNQGSGYLTAPTVTLSGVGSGAAAAAIVEYGQVVGFVVNNGGAGYSTPPSVQITGGGSASAQNFSGATINNSNWVSFAVNFGSSGDATGGIYQQQATGTPIPVVIDNDPVPGSVPGGGRFFTSGSDDIVTLANGNLAFPVFVGGGTGAFFAFMSGPAGGTLSPVMTTGDPLPTQPTNPSIVMFNQGMRPAGNFIPFAANYAGGHLGIFEYNNSNQTVSKVAVEGDSATGINGQAIYFGQHSGLPEVFANTNGQVAFSGGFSGSAANPVIGGAVFRFDPINGLQKVVAQGDVDPNSGLYYKVHSDEGTSAYGPTPINASGQVYFRADLGNNSGGFVGVPGSAPVKVVLDGDPAPGGGTISLQNPNSSSSSSNGNKKNPNTDVFLDNGSVVFPGQISPNFISGLFVARPVVVGNSTTYSLAKIAQYNDPGPNGTNYYFVSDSASVSSDGSKVLFGGYLSSNQSGLFTTTIGAPGVNSPAATAIALDGESTPAGGTFSLYGFLPNAVINSSGNAAFFSNITGGSGASGAFYYSAQNSTITAVASEGQAAPGSGTNFGSFNPYVSIVGETLFLTDANELYFAAGLANQPDGGAAYVWSNGLLEEVGQFGGALPNAGPSGISAGGTYHVDAVNAYPAYAETILNGTVNEAIYQIAPSSADLSVAFNGSAPSSIPLNVTQQVTFNVTNNGPDDAPNAVFTFTPPAGVNVISAPENCTILTNVTCNLGTVPINFTESIAISFVPKQLGTVTLQASVSNTGTTDPVSTNNSVSAPTSVVAGADIFVTPVNPPATSVAPGTSVSYSFNVGNNGSDNVSSITATFGVPAGFTPTALGGSGATCTLGTLICTISSPAINSPVTITLTGTANLGAGYVTATVGDGGYADPLPSNNTVSLPLNVNGGAVIDDQIVKSILSGIPAAGLMDNPASTVINQNNDFVFGDGYALFVRPFNTGVTSRLQQYGDAFPDANSRVQVVQGPRINPGLTAVPSQVLAQVNWINGNGISVVGAVKYLNGTSTIIAESDGAAPGGGGNLYGSVAPIGVDDAGDVAFSAPIQSSTGVAQNTNTLFIAMNGFPPVHILGVGDTLQGSTLTSMSVIGFNNAGQALISGTLSNASTGFWLGSTNGTTATVTKVVMTGDALPGSTNATTFNGALLNNNGQVAFVANNLIWEYNGTIQQLGGVGSSTNLPDTVTGNVALQAFSDGQLALYLASTSTHSTVTSILRQSVGGTATVVAYGGETVTDALNASQTISSFGAMSINKTGVVAFRANFSASNGIFTQTNANPPVALASAGLAVPTGVSGGGVLNFVGSQGPRILDNGLTYFSTAVAKGGTAQHLELLGSAPTSLQVLMTGADPLPSGANVSLRTFGMRVAGNYIGFFGSYAGGRISLFVTNTSTNTTSRVLTEGDTSPAGGIFGPVATTNEVFVNPSGQVAFTANSISSANNAVAFGVWLWSPGSGVTKIVMNGDQDPTTFSSWSALSISGYVNSPLNASGQVLFHATLGGSSGLFVGRAGQSPQKVFKSGDPASFGGSFLQLTATSTFNEVLTDSGQVFFLANLSNSSPVSGVQNEGIFSATPVSTSSSPSSTKIAAVGANTSAGQLSGFSSAISVTNSGTVLFQANLVSGGSGLFLASASSGPQPLAVNGGAPPSPLTGTYTFGTISAGSSMDAAIADNSAYDGQCCTAVFRASLGTGSSADSGIFLARPNSTGGQNVTPLAYQGESAPGTLNQNFDTILTGSSARAGELLTLTSSDQVYFSTRVATGSLPLAGVWLYRPNGTAPEKFYLRTDSAPGTSGFFGGGSQNMSVAGGANPAFYNQIIGNSASVSDVIIQAPIQADLATSFGGGAPPNLPLNTPQQVDLKVYNFGPNTATNVTATATLSGVTGTFSNYPNYCTVNSGNTVLTCLLASVPPSTNNQKITYSLKPTSTGPLTLTNNVSTSDQSDPNTSNNTASVTGIQIVNGADIFVTAPASPIALTPGQTGVTVNFTAATAGPDVLAGTTTVTITQPAGFTITSLTIAGVSGASCSNSAPWTCSIPSQSPAATWSSTVTVTGNAGSAPGTFYLGATITDGGYSDPIPGNNSGSATLNISVAGQSEYYFVAESYKDQIRQFQVSNNAEVTPPIATGYSPVSIAVSPNGRTAYVASRAGNFMSVVDIPTRVEIARWQIGFPIQNNLLITSDGTKLIDTGAGRIVILDATTGNVLLSQGLAGAISSVIVGNTVYVNSSKTTVAYHTVDLGTFAVNTVSSTMNVGAVNQSQENKSIAATPDGLYVVAARDNFVELINTQNQSVNWIPVPNGWTAADVLITRDASDPRGVYGFVSIPRLTPSGNVQLLVLDLNESSNSFGNFLSQDITLPFGILGSLSFSGDGSQIILAGNVTSGPTNSTATGTIVTLSTASVLSNSSTVLSNVSYDTRDTGGTIFRGITDAFSVPAGAIGTMPTVTSVSPNSWTADQSVSLTISGSNFTAGSLVRIGHNDLLTPVLNGVTSNSITVTVPAYIAAGATPQNIVVVDPNSTAGVQNIYLAGVMQNAVTVQQSANFQTAAKAVTLSFLDVHDSGQRILNNHVAFNQNLQVEPTGFTTNGTRAYALGVDGLTISNLDTDTLETTIPSTATSAPIQVRAAANPFNSESAVFALVQTQTSTVGTTPYYDYAVQMIDASGTATNNQVLETVDANVSFSGNQGSTGQFAVTSDGHYAYVPMADNSGTQYFWVFDMVNKVAMQSTAIPEMDMSDWPYLNITPDDTYLLALDNNGGIDVYNLTSKASPYLQTTIAPVSPITFFLGMQVVGTTSPFLYASDGPHFEVFNFSPGINTSLVGTYTNNEIPVQTVFETVPMSVSPDGNYLYVAVPGYDQVDVFSTAAIKTSTTTNNSTTALVARLQSSDGPLQVQTVVSPTADLGVGINAPTGFIAGQNMTYNTTVTNYGAETATNVNLTIPVPSGSSVVTMSNGCSGTSTVVCNIGSLAQFAAAQVSLQISTPISPQTITLSGSVTLLETDSNLSNNSASQNVILTNSGGADEFISTSSSPVTANVGDTVNLSFTAGTSGPDTADITVVITPPAGFQATSLITSVGTCSMQAVLSCDIGLFASGSANIQLSGTLNRPVSGGQFSAYVAPNGVPNSYPDPITANNSVTIPVTVSGAAANLAESYFAVDSYTHNVRQFQASSDTEVTPPVAAGALPESMAVSPNGRTAYIPSRASNYISVVDIPSRLEIARWNDPLSFPQQTLLTPDGSKLVIIGGGANVEFLDATTGSVLGSAPVHGTNGVVVGNALYVNSSTTGLGVQHVDLGTYNHTLVTHSNIASAGSNSVEQHTIDATPDGRYVVAIRGDHLFVIDAGADQVISYVAIPNAHPHSIAISRVPNDVNGIYAYIAATPVTTGSAGQIFQLDLNPANSTFGSLLTANTVTLPVVTSSLASIALTSDDSELLVATNTFTPPGTGTGTLFRINTQTMLTSPATAVTSTLNLGSYESGGNFVRGLTAAFAATAQLSSAPTISSVQPNIFPTDTARNVTINGSNFVNGDQVRIGSGALLATTVINSSTLSVTVPQFSPDGAYNVVVVNPNTGSGVQQMYQAGALQNGITIQQASTFQPTYPIVSAQYDDNFSFGSRTLQSIFDNQNNYAFPTGFALSPDGKRTYITGVDGIVVTNLATKTVEKTIAPPASYDAYYGQIVPGSNPANGNPVVFALLSTSPSATATTSGFQVVMIDAQDGSSTVNTVLNSVDAGVTFTNGYYDGAMAVSSNGRYAYVPVTDELGNSVLYVFDMSAATVQTSQTVPELNADPNAGGVPYLNVTSDGHYMLGSASSGGGVLVYDILTSPTTPFLVTTVLPVTPAAAFKGFQVVGANLFASDNANHIQTFTFQPSTPNFNWLGTFTAPDTISSPLQQNPIVVSPDGAFLYAAILGGDMIDVFDANQVSLGASNALVGRMGTTLGPYAVLTSPVANPSADLVAGVTIADVVDTQDLTYTVTATNNGTGLATNVVLTDQVPAGLTLVSAPGCTGTTTLTCSVGTLAVGASRSFTVDVGLVSGAGITNTTTVSVTGDQADPNTANNTINGSSTVQPASDISVGITPSSTNLYPGATVTYTINVGSSGPDAAGNVLITDALPSQLTFQSVDNTGLCSAVSNTVTCNTGSFLADATLTINVTALVNSGGAGLGTIFNSVTATPNDTDLNPGNNTATSSITSVSADVSLAVDPNCAINCTVSVINNGPSDATSVVLTDTLNRFTFVSATPNVGACSQSLGVITCNLGTITAFTQAQVVIVSKPPTSGWASHQLHSTAGTYDPNTVNNSVQTNPGSNPALNTQAGLGVSVMATGAGASAVVSFDSVVQPGTTAVSVAPFTAPPPAGFRSGTPALVYDVTTSATYSGGIRVTLPFNAAMFHHPAKARVFHFEGGAWVDRTLAVDLVSGAITAGTTSLSPFLVVEPLDVPPVAKAVNAIASATSLSGAQVKLDATQSSDADGDPLTYRWTGSFPEGGGTVTGATPTVTLGAGSHQLTLIVNDGEVDSPPISVTATVADFQLALASTTATMKSGQSATFSLNVGSQFATFSNPVSLSCANLPSGYGCSFSQAQVTPGAAGATTTITIAPLQTAQHHRAPLWPLSFAAAGLVLTGASSKRRRWLLLLMVLALLVTMIACGGGSGMSTQTQNSQPAPTPSTTSIVTVTGASNGVTHSATVTLTIQQP